MQKIQIIFLLHFAARPLGINFFRTACQKQKPISYDVSLKKTQNFLTRSPQLNLIVFKSLKNYIPRPMFIGKSKSDEKSFKITI